MNDNIKDVKNTAPMPVLIIMGTAGCGKSSVAKELHQRLSCKFIEGDLLHSESNIEKMTNGIPLLDEDRFPWLASIREAILQTCFNNVDTTPALVVTCSALRRCYRDIFRNISPTVAQITFVYLKGTREELLQRMSTRKNHFMAASMLQSQLDILEEPATDEKDVIAIDISQSFPEVVQKIIDTCHKQHLL